MQEKKIYGEVFKQWLPFAAVIILMSGLSYTAVQQNYRMSANDPQIQFVEEIAEAINSGKATPDAIVPETPPMDLAKSLSYFVTVYTATGTPLGSSISLDGKMPTPPAGVFDQAQKSGQVRFTWQPKPDLRLAAVISKFDGPNPGFVLSARSLREVELRIASLTRLTALALAFTLLAVYIILLWLKHMARPTPTLVIEESVVEVNVQN